MIKEEEIRNLLRNVICPIEEIIEINVERPYGISKLRGAYILLFGNNKSYVGSTIDIHRRLFQHISTSNIKIHHVIFLRTKDMEDALLLEDWLKRNIDCTNKINPIADYRYKSKIKKISTKKITSKSTKIQLPFLDVRKLVAIKDRPNILVLHLPTSFVKKAGFSPDQMVQVIFDKGEIKIVKNIKSVDTL